MGKYRNEDFGDIPEFADMERMDMRKTNFLFNAENDLQWIANELAEANRLKRLEIRLNQGLLTKRSELKEELEDQA